MWNNYKSSAIRVMGVLEGEEKEKGIKEIFEAIRTENFSKVMNTKPQTQKT